MVREAHSIDIPEQLLIGLLAGLALAAVARTRARLLIINKVKLLHAAAGPSLTYAVGLGALCLTSVTMLLAHLWLGPTVFLSAALVVLLVNRRWFGCPGKERCDETQLEMDYRLRRNCHPSRGRNRGVSSRRLSQ